MNSSVSCKPGFVEYLWATNVGGSGKAASYLRALELLDEMLQAAPLGFEDCQDVWGVDSVERLIELRLRVLEEQKLGKDSAWMMKGIPVSYLRNGYCSAALAQLIEFLTQAKILGRILRILDFKTSVEASMWNFPNITRSIPKGLAIDPGSKNGGERLQFIKVKMEQRQSREVILLIYQNRCCLTGIDLPEVNRASHIIGWAERAQTRMDPRNGICLSATYDAAFDRKLITFDEDYRLVLSKSIRDRVPSQTLKTHFLSKEGQRMDFPVRFHPLKEYLDHHRKGGEF